MENQTLTTSTSLPDASNLQRDAILESMLEHISEFQPKYTSVDIQALKTSVLTRVIDAPDPSKKDVEFSQEVQLRGFLKTFENTPAYSSQFKILDSRTKAQIKAFKDKPNAWKDEPIWKDTKEKGFKLPELDPVVSEVLATSSPPKNPAGSVKRCFSRAFVKVARPLVMLFINLKMLKSARSIENKRAEQYAKGPKIYEYEDEKATPPMHVC